MHLNHVSVGAKLLRGATVRRSFEARNPEEIDRAFAEMVRKMVHGAIFATKNSFFLDFRKPWEVPYV